MNFHRRHFLGSSLLVFGSTLMDALATPLWRWKQGVVLQSIPAPNRTSTVQFVDVGREAGLNIPNVWGGVDHKLAERHYSDAEQRQGRPVSGGHGTGAGSEIGGSSNDQETCGRDCPSGNLFREHFLLPNH
jgi:hypothetical protein